MAFTIVNKMNNVGAGAGLVWRDEQPSNILTLKTIKAGNLVTVTNNPDDITLDLGAPATGSAFIAHKSAAQSVPTSSFARVIFDVQDQDNLGEYDPATGYFLPSVAGWYQISWRVAYASAAWTVGKFIQAETSTAFSYYGLKNYVQAAGTFAIETVGSVSVLLPASNFYIETWHNQGAAVNIVEGHFSGHRLLP